VHWEDREKDVQVELQLLADHIILSQTQRHESVPGDEELLALAEGEGVDHVVEPSVLIQHQVLLEPTFVLRYFFLQGVDSFHETVLQEVLHDRRVYIPLRRGEVLLPLVGWGLGVADVREGPLTPALVHP